MKTKFIKVAVSEEKPKATGFYWIENIVGEMKSSYYDSFLKMFIGGYAKFWLKPVPDNESALIKRNEELEKMLDKIVYGYEEGLAEDVKFHYKQITEMKTKIISELKKEILVVELPEGQLLMDFNNLNKLELNGFKKLGFINEIREEDAKELVELFSIQSGRFKDYLRPECGYKTATESLLSALESEIYWDKYRTLIFIKN